MLTNISLMQLLFLVLFAYFLFGDIKVLKKKLKTVLDYIKKKSL